MKFHKPNLIKGFNAGIIKDVTKRLSPTKIAEHLSFKESTSKAARAGEPKKEPPRCSDGSENKDLGNSPHVFDLTAEAINNENFRTALWTGRNLQLTVMDLAPGEETGVEYHPGTDQILGIVRGNGEVLFGRKEGELSEQHPISIGSAVMIPSGVYHNLKNTSRSPLKIFSVYAPKKHPFGTVDKTREDSEKRESKP